MVAGIREVMRLDEPYLTDQLIPYIGNKRKLLPLLYEGIKKTGVTAGTFFDAFAGSGVVSRLAKTAGFRVIANDWEPYAAVINRAYIEVNTAPEFAALGGLDQAIASLNTLEGVRGYIATHYCPADDENYDTTRERMFYTQCNGRRIDAMREQIETWHDDGVIDSREKATLLAPLIFQAAYCSNTSGVFKGFHNGWGGATRTAWYRIRSYLTLRKPLHWNNSQENLVLREDALAVAGDIECDVAYLDPPYNQHQYGANYHLLNTIALWDKPPISPYISGNGKRDKAAIRTDWRSLRRSAYCYASTALEAFEKLLGRLRAHHIMVSYSTDGLIPVRSLLEVMAERGKLEVITRRYKRYRVSSQRPSPRPHTVEFVAILDTSKSGGKDSIASAVKTIMSADEYSGLTG